MHFSQKLSLFLLRTSLGCMMFYAGITKVLDPAWSPFSYLARAETFSGFYMLFLDPIVLPYVTFFNAWGLTLIGIALIIGLGVRLASVFGIFMMVLYYFPVLTFPYVSDHSFLIDQHVIYATGFLLLITFKAGRVWSIGTYLHKTQLVNRFPFLNKVLE